MVPPPKTSKFPSSAWNRLSCSSVAGLYQSLPSPPLITTEAPSLANALTSSGIFGSLFSGSYSARSPMSILSTSEYPSSSSSSFFATFFLSLQKVEKPSTMGL